MPTRVQPLEILLSDRCSIRQYCLPGGEEQRELAREEKSRPLIDRKPPLPTLPPSTGEDTLEAMWKNAPGQLSRL